MSSRAELLRARIEAEKKGLNPDDVANIQPQTEKEYDEDSGGFKNCHFCGQSTKAYKIHILKALRSVGGNVSKCARVVGITRGRLYGWVENDREFAYQFNKIRKESGWFEDF